MLKTRDLSVLGYANGFTLWHFVTGDKADDLERTGYFDEAADMLRPGDFILANSSHDNSHVASLLLSVAAIDDGCVSLGALGKIDGNNKKKKNGNMGARE